MPPRYRKSLFVIHCLLSASLVAGCQSAYKKAIPEFTPPPTPPDLSAKSPAMLNLSSIRVDVAAGTELGETRSGWNGTCSDPKPIIFRRAATETNAKLYEPVFRDVMGQAGVPVQGAQRFEGEEVRKADFQVAASIKDLALNICYPDGRVDLLHAIGESQVLIEWSLFSPVEKRVVFTASTRGQAPPKTDSRLGEAGIIREAFGNALRQLLADPELIAVLTTKQGVAAAALKQMSVEQPARLSGRIQDNLESIRRAVVTVQSNAGSGSGFAIGAGDLIVTNSHVVSGSQYVKVIGTKGDERYGEVIRKNAARDLALIRLDRAHFRALHVTDVPLKEGIEIFAIGSPLGRDLEFSVTRGIVSGFRKFQELTYIQSDVSVLPGSSGGPLMDASGNVVGITSGGVAIEGAPAGLNFFIPAAEVFPALSIGGKAR